MNFILTVKKYISNTRHQVMILLLLALGLNINTLFNEYALDDLVVLTGNSLVEKGIKGIPEILTKEYFYGLDKKESDLSGGRYRPFALVLFAVEYQFFGANPFVSHLINVLLFVLLIYLLYRLLHEHLLRDRHGSLAFFTCLLFVVHPIHTEVIANVKSRDELITLVLLLTSAFAIIRYVEKRSPILLVPALLCFFLALLTRESAVPFIGMVPLIAYFFYHQSVKKSLQLSLPLIAVFIVYLGIRVSVVGYGHIGNKDILNYPFVYASPTEAFATKVFLMIKYLWLLVFPHPLSFDYGYNEIPYISIGSVKFILSFMAIAGLLAYAVFTFHKRALFSFCILFFALTIFLFSNFVIDIGAPLAERLLFLPSLAFCIVIATWYLKYETKNIAVTNAIMLIVLILFSVKTIQRNFEWKNNATLFFADVKTCPNSVRTNLYAGQQCLLKAKSETDKAIKAEYYKKTIFYDERILSIYPHYRYIYEDLGFAYFGLNNFWKAADQWLQSYRLDLSNQGAKKRVDMLSDVFYNNGNNSYRTGAVDSAIVFYKKAVELNENNVDAWYNLGGSYFLINDTKNGIEAWQNVLRLAPNHPLDRERFQKKTK
ncbi:MAG: tetratricopeptide repeat protein [Bacteroidetes bacterium]|nr:tetratricopeptide repeat protein [Bacteroidota bacterium]